LTTPLTYYNQYHVSELDGPFLPSNNYRYAMNNSSVMKILDMLIDQPEENLEDILHILKKEILFN